ncbi:hypothetical protein OPT61_g9584 [Boeremia exigua]|uniref:Uncharacterized protein n=1 Tax=Boeremia exigua TaxID=749465 RepID=A0ACC2HUH6_9PLEO|nr:hypothetical protein OPT61_g9584 [Boeremia exigua]
MRFYGFDAAHYARGFASETELFAWVAAGRFFSGDVFAQRVEKAADKSRQLKRPMYRRFVEVYMPTHCPPTSRVWTREEVLREAVAHFSVQGEYDRKIAVHDAEKAELELWKEIKAVLPATDKALKSATRALRRWVVFSDRRPVFSDRSMLHTEYLRWKDHVGEDNKEDILAWVGLNWHEAKRRDREYDKRCAS